MKSSLTLIALALSFVAAGAHAGRDESLIKQTRKNQLAHDAGVKRAQQALAAEGHQDKAARQDKEGQQDAAPATAAGQH